MKLAQKIAYSFLSGAGIGLVAISVLHPPVPLFWWVRYLFIASLLLVVTNLRKEHG